MTGRKNKLAQHGIIKHRKHSRRVYHFRPSMPKFFIKTYGCQMNERDSEQVAHSLVERGYERVGRRVGS